MSTYPVSSEAFSYLSNVTTTSEGYFIVERGKAASVFGQLLHEQQQVQIVEIENNPVFSESVTEDPNTRVWTYKNNETALRLPVVQTDGMGNFIVPEPQIEKTPQEVLDLMNDISYAGVYAVLSFVVAAVLFGGMMVAAPHLLLLIHVLKYASIAMGGIGGLCLLKCLFRNTPPVKFDNLEEFKKAFEKNLPQNARCYCVFEKGEMHYKNFDGDADLTFSIAGQKEKSGFKKTKHAGVFDYYLTANAKPLARYPLIVVMPDGSILAPNFKLLVLPKA